jgi:hypothetical protein
LIDPHDRLTAITLEADRLLSQSVGIGRRYQPPPQTVEQAMAQAGSAAQPPYALVWGWLRQKYGLTVEDELEIWHRLGLLAATAEEYRAATAKQERGDEGAEAA